MAHGESLRYEVLTADSLLWLSAQPDGSVSNVVSGLPDIEELGMTDMDEYVEWFNAALSLLFSKTGPHGYIILIQTDRKRDGRWLDKSTMVNNSADEHGWNLLWHKIILTRPVESANLHRPTYSHFLCYSQLSKPGNGLPDVIEGGSRWYKNGTPVNAARFAVDFLLEKRGEWEGKGWQSPSSTWDIVDPFVGQGTVMYYGVMAGLSVLGIDIDPDQTRATRDMLDSV